ncbi:hypothetical protein BH10PSE4_BH10PSE4_03150 [soil metagenome]
MTPDAFIAIGSGLAMVKAKTVLGAVRLAVGGKTFATVGWPEAGWAVVKLTRDDQKGLIALSNALASEPGQRGSKGVTLVRLAAINEPAASRVLLAAWRLAQGQASEVAA